MRLNPTGRAIHLTVPAMDGAAYLGDIVITIEPNDTIEFSSQRAVDLLANTLNQAALDSLRNLSLSKPVLTTADGIGSGVTVAYNSQNLQLVFSIPPEVKASRSVAVFPGGGRVPGEFVKPAHFSAYMNARGSIDYIETGPKTGLQSPVIFLDGAAWSHGIALESEGIWEPGVAGVSAFQRQGTRVVYDDTDNEIRWTGGDLQPVGQGFQSVPDISGFSLFRSYGVLDPLRSVRPGGDQSFRLTRPSDVTITMNGSTVRRLRLDPGLYNLRDFPFAQGSNDVTVSIQDDTGRQETLRFNVFMDQTQLAEGLSEFGFYAGLKSPLGPHGRDYLGPLEATGYYRRGVSNDLTLGANFQIDAHSVLGGAQALWGSPIGTFGIDAGVSGISGFGTGYAATLTFQRLFEFVNGQGDSFNLAFTTHSTNFGPVGTIAPSNPYGYEVSSGYSHAFSVDFYGSLTAHYGHGRGGQPDTHDYHAMLGYRLADNLGFTVDGSYREGSIDHGFGALLSLTWSVDQSSSVRGDFNTRQNDARLSYQNVSGTGVGSYNLSAEAERSDTGSSINGIGNYISNRAELGLSQFSNFAGSFGSVTDERTSAHFGTSLAFADGSVSVGRPISQSFAIVKAHPSLEGADVIVDPTPDSYEASTHLLGTATDAQLSAYVPRTITVDAPTAPAGYDLGNGSFRVLPPYRAGYRLEVGSDYSITAIGRLVTDTGEPLTLIAGKAFEVGNPQHEPIELFTNGQGRFGLSGLKPGQWRIEMPTEPTTIYILTVPDGAKGVVRAGDLKPSETGK